MRIAILGAGSIGCYVGGRLRAAGADVVFCGRAHIGDMLARHGLTASHYALPSATVAAEHINFRTTPDALADADTILLTVKSQGTAAAASQIAANARREALVVSLQNGVRNASVLSRVLPGWTVAAGMVPFNVVQHGDGVFHCGTEGDVVLQSGAHTDQLVAMLKDAGVATTSSDNMPGVLWGKLLLNLNNALNALSDLPIKTQLEQRDHRRVLALCIEEGLLALQAAGIRPARIGKVLPSLVPHILRLPDFAFRLVARGMLRIDPNARSSMWQDLEAGRPPEIDYLNGEIATLGDQTCTATPVNERVVALIREAFEAGRSPALSGADLLAGLGSRT